MTHKLADILIKEQTQNPGKKLLLSRWSGGKICAGETGKGVRLDATNTALDPHKPGQKPLLGAEGRPQSWSLSGGAFSLSLGGGAFSLAFQRGRLSGPGRGC